MKTNKSLIIPILIGAGFLIGLIYYFYSYIPQPKIIWQHSGTNLIGENQNLQDGSIYFRDSTFIYAVDIKSGNEKWRYPKSQSSESANQINGITFSLIRGDKIYIPLTEPGTFIILNKNTGEKLPTQGEQLPIKQAEDVYSPNVISSSDTTYILEVKDRLADLSVSDVYIKAVDNETKRTKWRWDKKINPPFYEKDGVVYFLSESNLYAVR
jgi:outer membrane protein assembly factor BamB